MTAPSAAATEPWNARPTIGTPLAMSTAMPVISNGASSGPRPLHGPMQAQPGRVFTSSVTPQRTIVQPIAAPGISQSTRSASPLGALSSRKPVNIPAWENISRDGAYITRDEFIKAVGNDKAPALPSQAVPAVPAPAALQPSTVQHRPSAA